MFKYHTRYGTVSVQVGKQNFENMTVEVNEEDGNKLTCDMFHEDDGDIGFTLYKMLISFRKVEKY
ncbi:hypothetical protein N399_24615 (plasmid) [Bacillus licheniformis CG-B52]|uniref:hypothetical protein n=1 Tax=Bacillus licheniformis TaxID=1402 RepID=UPI00038E5F37|nr:hypothetical protein [Bacillus licheniformis]EQM25426.1 hypothetical protein N399_24615 [Bacillus licheniformis CG-B52]